MRSPSRRRWRWPPCWASCSRSRWVRWIAAGALLAFGVLHLRSHSHPRWGVGGMCVGPRQLTTWSFLVSSAHGAGLMVLPFVLRSGDNERRRTRAPGVGGHAAHLAGVAVSGAGDHTTALLATLVHTAGYLAVAGAIAWVVYERLGLRFLRSAWINMNVVWAAALIVTAAVLLAPAAHGQDRTGVNTWGFVNARYDSRASASLYAGYGWRRAFAMVGVLHNPRSGYAELLGGVGAAFRTGAHADHWVVLASAQAGSITSAQVYWLPTVRAGGVTTRAMLKWTVPYQGSTAQKLSMSPLSMTLPIGRRLAGGVAVDVAAAEGARSSIATGPQLRLRLPRAALGADVLRDVRGNSSRLRLSFASLF